jgi:hypothetical protein
MTTEVPRVSTSISIDTYKKELVMFFEEIKSSPRDVGYNLFGGFTNRSLVLPPFINVRRFGKLI